jgi:hypothetical protein
MLPLTAPCCLYLDYTLVPMLWLLPRVFGLVPDRRGQCKQVYPTLITYLVNVINYVLDVFCEPDILRV